MITPTTLAGLGGGPGRGVGGGGDGGADLGQVGAGGDVGGHGVDEVAEGAEPDAGLDGGGGGGREVDLVVELDHADRALDADVGDAGPASRGGQAGAQGGFDAADLGGPALGIAVEQDVQGRVGDRDRERVAHERGAVGQHRQLAAGDAGRDLGGAQGSGQGQVAAGQRLADAHHVRADPGVPGREQLPAAAEPGGDLVEDQ